MAIFYPSLADIRNLKRQPEPGEGHILSVLDKLHDSYEVYFQPFLNGDRPDIVVLKKNYGVLIIEVKDWSPYHYYIDERGHWYLKLNGSKLKSPIDQAYRYKRNLFELHIADFLNKHIYDAKYWRIVKSAVYFFEFSKDQLEKVKQQLFVNEGRMRFIQSNVALWSKDVFPKLIQNTFEGIKKSANDRFGEQEYKSIVRFLRPSEFDYEQFSKTSIKFTQQQQKLIFSEPREQWVKGVVGSGKTTVLSARAAKAFERVNARILILTYNITLKNYIHDKIARVTGKFDPSKFYVTHYDHFIATEMNNYGLTYDLPQDFNTWTNEEKAQYFEEYHADINLFEPVKDAIEPYPVILIDETQDFKKAWLDIVKKYFLKPNGEYVLFSDEKQNIYSREINNKDIRTNVAQRPTSLKESVRSAAKLKETFIDYQHEYLSKKYNADDHVSFLSTQLGLNYTNEKISYIDVGMLEVTRLFNRVREITKSLSEPPKNVAVLGETIEFLRDFDLYYRVKTNEMTNPMFESLEEYFGIILSTLVAENMGDQVPKDLRMHVKQEGYSFWPEHQNADKKNRALSSLLALHRTERNAPDDRHFKSNAEDRNEMYRDPLVKKWLQRFTDAFEEHKNVVKGTDRFLSHVENRLNSLRGFRKGNFWFHTDGIKLSTIHSFKGWEASTVFFIVEPKYRMNSESMNELIYTSITRAKNNLVVLNFGNTSFKSEFKDFFENHVNM